MRTPKSRNLALTSLLFGVLLPGCPFTDGYFVDPATGGAAQLGTPGTGGVPMVTPNDGDANAPGNDPAGGQAGVDDPDAPRGGTAGSGNGATWGVGGNTTGTGGLGWATGGSGGDGAAAGTTASAGTGGSGGSSVGGKAGKGDAGSTNGGSSWGVGGATAGSAGKGGSDWGGKANQPACDDGIGKGDPCGPSSVQVCYKTCGPDSLGVKPETCQRGEYVEGECSFPDGNDYSCYAIPTSKPAGCPAGTPRAAQSCKVAECTPCFGGMADKPAYEDSTGAQKEGYCVCTDEGKWTCASLIAWPCPDGDGC